MPTDLGKSGKQGTAPRHAIAIDSLDGTVWCCNQFILFFDPKLLALHSALVDDQLAKYMVLVAKQRKSTNNPPKAGQVDDEVKASLSDSFAEEPLFTGMDVGAR